MRMNSFQLTPYRIKRNHSNETGFFIVNVPEVNQYGIGFQLRRGAYVYGFSFSFKIRISP